MLCEHVAVLAPFHEVGEELIDWPEQAENSLRGLQRFRTEQPAYSILSRGIEREVLPVAQGYGMGILVWGPLGQGMLTGRVRNGRQNDLRRAAFLKSVSDERRLDAVEQFIPLAEKAGLPMTHLALAFTIAHPGVTSAIIGPHAMEQLDDLLAGIDVALTDDQVDEIVPPGTDIGTLDRAYRPPALQQPGLRRRPASEWSSDPTPRDDDYVRETLRHGNLQVDLDDANPRPMIAVLDARPGTAAQFREKIIELVREVRREPGCLAFTAYQACDAEGRFYLYEIYATAAAFAEHLQTEHVHRFIASIPALSTSGPGSVIQLEEIPVD